MGATLSRDFAAFEALASFAAFEAAGRLQAEPARIASEEAEDAVERERLLDEAFGPARFAKAAERLRAGRTPARGLALKAAQDGLMIGTLRLWRIHSGFGRPALLLGPLAVAARRRGEGVGAALVEEALRRAKSLGHRAVLLVGDAAYYARFGFTRRGTEALIFPGEIDPKRFLALEIVAGALNDARGHVLAG